MVDKSVKKVSSGYSPKGDMGQKYLASGKGVAMRLWEEESAGTSKPPTQRQYEVVGYVIKGRSCRSKDRRYCSSPEIHGWSRKGRPTVTPF